VAASQEQKVDFLLKKIGYVASKTGIAEDESSLTGTKKAPFGEAIPSPLVVPATNIWSDSSLIPTTPPGSTGATVQVYLAGTSGHQMTADSTISSNRTFIAYSTYNNSSTAILGNWIDTSFGADYIVKVYKGDPNSGGVQLSAAGSGSNDTWFFDYSSGVLNFNGTSVPSGVTSSNIYIVGYRYVGGTGISPTAGFGTFASLNVSGISTFAGLVDANGGVTANTLIVEDLTDNRVVIAGTGGELEDSANLTFDGSTLVLTGDQTISGTIDVDGLANFDDILVSAASTFTGNIDANGDLDVNGRTELDVTNISETLNVVGISTFAGNIDANGDLDVDGRTELDITNISETLNVTGISTFASNIDANGDLDVDGRTELDDVNISETLSVTGISTFTGAIDANGDLDVDGRTELDITNISETLSVTGISTFTGAIDANGDLDVDGHTELDDVNISGVATATAFHTGAEGSAIRITSNTISGPAELFIDPAGVGDNTGAVRIKGDLYVDGTQTIINSTTIELADFVVGIATTATSDAVANGAGIKIGSDNTFLYDHPNTSLKSSENINLASSKTYKIDGTDVLSATTLGSGVVNSSLTNLGTLTSLTISGNLDVDGYAELDDLNVSGISTFAGEIDANGRIVGAATNNVIPFLYSNLAALPSASTYHGAFAHVHSEGKAYYAHAAAWYELVNKEINGVVGTGTERYNVGFVDATNLDISGVSTFAGAADFNGNVDIDGHTELDYINVSAASTFAGLVDINAGGQADTFKIEDLTSGRVVLAGTGGEIEDSANLTFNGTLLALTGNQTISGTIDVDGLSNFDDILVSAASTFTGNIDANGDLDVDGRTELDTTNISETLNVVGLSTFASNIDANGDLDVDGRTELDTTNISETLNVVGIATFASNIDANGNLDVDGYTELDDLNVTGVSTFAGLVDINAGGQANTFKVEDLTDNRVVIAGTGGELEDDSNLTFNGTTLAVGVNLDVDGQTDLDITNISETLNVTGIATFSSTVYLNGTVSAASSTGANGQVLQSTGIGVTWATLPTARTNSIQTATEDQTTFNFNYNVGYLDVFYNGVKLASSEFTASNGTTVVLGDVAFAGDVVEFISYNTVSTGGGGGGAALLNELSDVTITGTPIAGETLQHNGTAFVNDYTTTATTTSTSQFTLMSLDLSVYRSIEYTIQVTEGSNFHVTKILAIHNGTAAIHNEYGTLSTNTSVASFDVDISGSNIRLLATPASTNSTAFKVKFTTIKV